jgi:integrase
VAVKITREFLRDLKVETDIDIPDSELRGFYVRARASGKRFFYIIKRVGPRLLKIRLGDCALMTITEAREKARQQLARLELGEMPVHPSNRTTERTLLDFIDGSYGDRLMTEVKQAEATKKRLKSVFSDLLAARLDRIDAVMIDRWRSNRVKSGAKPSTINRNLNDLRALFTFALQRGLVETHPMQTVKRLREDAENRIRYLSPDEEAALRSALDMREETKRAGRERGNQWRIERSRDTRADLRLVAYVDHLKPAVLISLNTGLRQGELFKLRWPDVDLDRASVTVRASNAKSQKSRHVPLNGEAVATLKAWRGQTSGTGVVFPNREGKPITETKTAWARLLKDAGIQSFRWHDMRHHFASRLVMAGVDLNTVRELLGHSDIKMTLRYAHLAPEHKRAAVELISGTFGGSGAGKVIQMKCRYAKTA